MIRACKGDLDCSEFPGGVCEDRGSPRCPMVVTFKDSSIETIATFVATGRKPSLSGETRGWTAYYSYMDPTGSAPVDSGNISASATTGTR